MGSKGPVVLNFSNFHFFAKLKIGEVRSPWPDLSPHLNQI